MKGGNPKVRIWDDVVTYCDLESWRTRQEYPVTTLIRYITIRIINLDIFYFECVMMIFGLYTTQLPYILDIVPNSHFWISALHII